MKLHQFTNGRTIQRHGDFCKVQDHIFLRIVNGRHNSFPESTESIKRKIIVLDFDYNCQGLKLFL
ncbi:hypothetical protein EHQ23_04120 [Leptospira bourretii]|uniref:Uncharacterized protein n=1 Tax=Leptospira bourretii TaxID=2484962 RepID=A0A4R9IHZ9_9LEPT|nr:hypothetical protein EHQ23_04120 [Leptospira bourretii]TGK88689.1 hypothetical protein EHQ26_16645 [Leptospira bourretii]TGL33479.1 hypothetical protein EHQ45_09905 [Leptospira bourretii]